jgi:hypothetical protein
LNITEIVAHKHLLARITALEIAVAELERRADPPPVLSVDFDALLAIKTDPKLLAQLTPEKRKPGRPRKNA